MTALVWLALVAMFVESVPNAALVLAVRAAIPPGSGSFPVDLIAGDSDPAVPLAPAMKTGFEPT